jgi:hypothetical protein
VIARIAALVDPQRGLRSGQRATSICLFRDLFAANVRYQTEQGSPPRRRNVGGSKHALACWGSASALHIGTPALAPGAGGCTPRVGFSLMVTATMAKLSELLCKS